MNHKAKWAFFTLLILVLLGGALYFFINKKYYPKVLDVAYLRLDLTKDTAQVKAGLQVQNRVPLPISIDSVHYTIRDEGTKLGWGQMTEPHTLPPLGDEVLDFSMLLNFEKYRQHLKAQQGKDSIRLAIKTDVFFDLPFISPKSISLNRHLTVPVPKAPAMQLQDVVVQSFSVDSGYSFLLKIDATNQNLPNLSIQDFKYHIIIGDSLTISGEVDTTFHLQKGGKLLEIPLQLKTSDAIALVKKVLSNEGKWNYFAKVEAQVQSSHRLLDQFKLTVVKDGVLPINKMGKKGSYLPTIDRVKRLAVTSTEEETLVQAEVLVKNPSPIPFYIDSVSYFIRHNGNLIASGKKDYETVLNTSARQVLNLKLLVDEAAYLQFMQRVQGQEKAIVDVSLNLLYHLPNAEKQSIRLVREIQVPVQGQFNLQVAGLEVRELSPSKGAFLGLQLKVQSSNLPDLSIHHLNYQLKLETGIVIKGHSQKPITVGSGDAMVEVPLHLTAGDVNQLINKALKGNKQWKYDLQATATLRSKNKMIGPTEVNLEFEGGLELKKGMGGKQFMPHITKIDTLQVVIRHDTAWVNFNINVKNPLPVAFKVDSLLLTLGNGASIFATSREGIGKVLPAEGNQSAWVTLSVNYGLWQDYLTKHQGQDSLTLQETVTLVYQLEDLAQQRATFHNQFRLPTPGKPVTKLKKVKLRGFSFSKGILMNGQVQVKNLNVKELEVKNIFYRACVENVLDVCDTLNKTYHIAEGESIVTVPMNFGVGEAFRALIAKLSGKNKTKDVLLNATATVNTSNPVLQNTFVELQVLKEVKLFQKK